MEIIRLRIGRKELLEKYCSYFRTMSKAVVDVKRHLLAVDADLHSDQEALLIEDGSLQEDLWGINLYPLKSAGDFIEFTSLINIRPHDGNTSMEVEDPATREKIRNIVTSLIDYES
jgi:hypothetical protein